ncbi:MAG: alpha/beta hydrolase fold domain-containing protein [Sedimentisphaerales bacterium]|nr:alpha/beta hydrolase fold domain-containing protein [Sedimentisphaerales bacterium]
MYYLGGCIIKNLLFSTILIVVLTMSSTFSQTISNQSSPAASEIQANPAIKIWQGKAPGSEDWTFSEKVNGKTYSNVVDPTLTVFLPEPEKANGAAIILCPGGAMRMLGFAETEQVAKILNSKGIAAFILKYRVVPDNPPASGTATAPSGTRGARGTMPGSAGGRGAMRGGMIGGGMPGGFGMGGELSFREILSRNGNANPAPDNQLHTEVIQMAIADGHQAIRVLRRDAAKYNIDPKRIGILGFSAGGGVAIGTAVTESPDAYPDFVATVYGPSLVDVNVPQQGAPLFIAVMDGHRNVTNGCAVLFALWKEAGRPVEIHVYDHANGSGSGMPIATWTDRLYDWLARRNIVTK